jgi:hypothetical protein
MVFPNFQPTNMVVEDIGFESRKFVTRYLLCDQRKYFGHFRGRLRNGRGAKRFDSVH